VIKTGGKWNPNDRHVIWLAGSIGTLSKADIPNTHDWFLIAVNELNNQNDILNDYKNIDNKQISTQIYTLNLQKKLLRNSNFNNAYFDISIKKYTDKLIPGSYYWLQEQLVEKIIVGKSTSVAHFTDIQSAVNYSQLFYTINYGRISVFENYIPPVLIREGEYTISSPIIIKQDISIIGSGANTVLKRGSDISSPASSGVPDPNTAIFIVQDGPAIGGSTASYSLVMLRGVTIKDLIYESSVMPSGSSTAFCIYQGSPPGMNRKFSLRFENISAYGTSERDTDNSIREYFLFCGRPSNSSLDTETSPAYLSVSNIFISSCFFHRMGAYQSGAAGYKENIIVELPMQSGSPSSSLDVRNIIVTSNIAVGVVPTNPSATSSILRTTTQGFTTSGIIEASNVVRTDL
jgi:hypothetical protein